MAYCQRLIAALLAALLAYTPTAWAAYATAPTPAGFGGVPGAWTVAAKPGDVTFQNLLKKAPFTPKDYGGSVAKLGSGYRYGTLARSTAATIVSLHPALRVGAGIAMWIGLAKLQWNASSATWEQEVTGEIPPDGGVYTAAFVINPGTQYYSKDAVCAAILAKFIAIGGVGEGCGAQRRAFVESCGVLVPSVAVIRVEGGSNGFGQCSPSQYLYPYTRAGDACPGGGAPPCPTVSYEPITPSQAATRLSQEPMPSTVPIELPPDTPLPIEGEPVNNPGPGTDMTPQTTRIPVGSPVPQADGTYKQPYVDIVPFPSPGDPWRVDVRPGDKVTTDGAPLPDPVPVKPGDPAPLPGTPPAVDPNDPNAKQRDPALQSLCEKHPGIAACAPYEPPPQPKDPVDPCLEHPERIGCLPPGELAPEQVANEDKQITLTPDGGWGSAGVCPPPRQITLAGGLSFQIPLDLLCDFARMIRPLIVAMAYLGAAMMLVGAARRE